MNYRHWCNYHKELFAWLNIENSLLYSLFRNDEWMKEHIAFCDMKNLAFGSTFFFILDISIWEFSSSSVSIFSSSSYIVYWSKCFNIHDNLSNYLITIHEYFVNFYQTNDLTLIWIDRAFLLHSKSIESLEVWT